MNGINSLIPTGLKALTQIASPARLMQCLFISVLSHHQHTLVLIIKPLVLTASLARLRQCVFISVLSHHQHTSVLYVVISILSHYQHTSELYVVISVLSHHQHTSVLIVMPLVLTAPLANIRQSVFISVTSPAYISVKLKATHANCLTFKQQLSSLSI